MTSIPIAKPYLNALEEEAVIRVMRSGWISQGPVGAKFEKALAKFIGVPYARGVNSGTSAIHLALLACGVLPGDEVIVPAFTCVATLNPIEQIGARPVPVDIVPDTFAIHVSRIQQAVTSKTRAVVVVHLFGLPAPVEDVLDAFSSTRVKLIEDVALGLGGKIGNRYAGSFGDASILSFHPRKTITTGEGGMVLTQIFDIDEKVAVLRNYGASVPAWERHQDKLFSLPRYEHSGSNYKLSDILAAIGLEQVKKLPKILAERRLIARQYQRNLSDLSWIKIPSEPSGYHHAYQSFVCQLLICDTDSLLKTRERLFEHLRQKGISSVPGAQSMATLSYYRRKYNWKPEDFPVALQADLGSFVLPLYPGLTENDQDRVIQAIRTFQP